jgi:hypothetical protein
VVSIDLELEDGELIQLCPRRRRRAAEKRWLKANGFSSVD